MLTMKHLNEDTNCSLTVILLHIGPISLSSQHNQPLVQSLLTHQRHKFLLTKNNCDINSYLGIKRHLYICRLNCTCICLT